MHILENKFEITVAPLQEVEMNYISPRALLVDERADIAERVGMAEIHRRNPDDWPATMKRVQLTSPKEGKRRRIPLG